MVAQTLSFSSIMVYITLIPLDVYATSNKTALPFNIQVYDIYFCKVFVTSNILVVEYLVMIALCFLILPFTYFYSEEALEGEEGDPFFDDDSDEEGIKKE